MPEKLLTPEEAAKTLVVTPRVIREWLRNGKLCGVKVGRLWRVRERDLELFIKPMEANKSKTIESEINDESRAWLEADIEGDFPPYEWGNVDPKKLGKPVRYVHGKGILIIEEEPNA